MMRSRCRCEGMTEACRALVTRSPPLNRASPCRGGGSAARGGQYAGAIAERERAVASRRRPGACRWSSGAGTPRSARCREDVGKLCIVRSSGFAHGRTLRTLQALNRRSGERQAGFHLRRCRR